jgi:poly-gamma-glutamate synthesis protein (capsule biosynthesis protein)
MVNAAVFAGGSEAQALGREPAAALGNLEPLARWLNRYLGPHGMRTQVLPLTADCLQVVVDCDQVPDRDRLVQFICHRLWLLNLSAIAGIRIVARLAGRSEVLWQHSVRLMGAGDRALSPTGPDLLEQHGQRLLRTANYVAHSLADTLTEQASALSYYTRRITRSRLRQLSWRLAQVAIASQAGISTGISTFTERTRQRIDAARRGDLDAVARWLDPVLVTQGLQGRIGMAKIGCLDIHVECPVISPFEADVAEFRTQLTRSLCHRIWQLRARRFEGVRILAYQAGTDTLLWQQRVRIAIPAGRRSPGPAWLAALQTPVLADPVWDKILRSLLLSGSALSAFLLAFWLMYYTPDVPTATAPSSPRSRDLPLIPGNRTEQVIPMTPAIAPVADRLDDVRWPLVQAALETVPVVPHTDLANPEDPTVTLMFGGDVTLSNSFERVVGNDYDWAFAKLDAYREADVAMVNLENPLTVATTRRPGKSFNFKAHPNSVQVLKDGGVDIVTLANNHTMDYQAAGLKETIATLDQAGIHAVGAGREITEARRPEILEVKGQRIAYLGYYNAHWHAAGQNQAGTNPRDYEAIAADIKAIRDQVDWVIVNYHWGEEMARYPAGYQIELAKFSIDQGADLVVGHHPHVLQGAEVYKGRPIVYSLGNFIFGGNSRTNYDTAVLKVALNQDRQMKVEFVPIEVRRYQAQVAQGANGQRILQHIAGISRHFATPMQSPMTLDAQRPKPPAIAQTPSESAHQSPATAVTAPPSTPPTALESSPQTSSTQTSSTQASSTLELPTQASPTQTSPTQASSTQASSTLELPTQASSTQASPTQASSTQASPTQAASAPSGAPGSDSPFTAGGFTAATGGTASATGRSPAPPAQRPLIQLPFEASRREPSFNVRDRNGYLRAVPVSQSGNPQLPVLIRAVADEAKALASSVR